MLQHRFLNCFCVLLLISCLVLSLAGCQKTGPQKTLDETARALRTRNSNLFVSQLDMSAFTYHELINLRQDNSLINLAGNLGSMLGLNRELEELIIVATNMQAQYTKTFDRTVASGQMMALCSRATSADCPWDPAGLEKAKVEQLDDNAAVACVTTSSKITSWIALRKSGETWLIVGKAPVRETAVLFALDEDGLPSPSEVVPVFPGQGPEEPAPSAEPASSDQGNGQS